ncbi:MAG: KEOPS complex subunit Cgi121 [Candidatus Odinarchaeota archaeon]
MVLGIPFEELSVEIRPYRLENSVHRDMFLQELDNFATDKGFQAITILNPDVFSTVNVFISAAWHALNAFNTGSNISSSLTLEIMLYVSCQRQIKEILNLYGVGEKVKEFIVIAIHREKVELMAELDDFIASCWSGTVADDLIEPPTAERAEKIAKLHGIDRFDENTLLERIASFSIENTAG